MHFEGSVVSSTRWSITWVLIGTLYDGYLCIFQDWRWIDDVCNNVCERFPFVHQQFRNKKEAEDFSSQPLQNEDARFCIGLRITRGRANGKVSLDQQQYVKGVLERFNMVQQTRRSAQHTGHPVYRGSRVIDVHRSSNKTRHFLRSKDGRRNLVELQTTVYCGNLWSRMYCFIKNYTGSSLVATDVETNQRKSLSANTMRQPICHMRCQKSRL